LKREAAVSNTLAGQICAVNFYAEFQWFLVQTKANWANANGNAKQGFYKLAN